jgi:hypothetical protein
MIDGDEARWLVSDAGLATVAALDLLHVRDDGAATLLERARRSGATPPQARAAVAASLARRRAADRWPDAARLLFTRESLEEATDPAISAWKAQRFRGASSVDLCAGIGGDATAIAAAASRTVAVEASEGRAVLLAHNASVRRVDLDVRVGDALAADLPTDVAVHADPDRREGGRRVRDPRRYRPGLDALVAHFRAVSGLAVTVGAGIRVEDPLLEGGETEFVQVGADLKEAVVWFGSLRRGSAKASATLLPAGHHVDRVGPPADPLAVRTVGTHLITPVPALVRARLHDELGARLGTSVGRLARTRALLTGEGPIPDSPWFRTRPVVDVLPLDARRAAAWLRGRQDGLPVEVAMHGLEEDPVAWWRAIGRPPRGPHGLRLELVRLDRGSIVIVTDDRPLDRGSHERGAEGSRP